MERKSDSKGRREGVEGRVALLRLQYTSNSNGGGLAKKCVRDGADQNTEDTTVLRAEALKEW